MPILVTNLTDRPLMMHSFDGNSVQIGPKARSVPVAKKFEWQHDAGLRIVDDLGEDVVDPTTVVNGRPVAPLLRAPKTAEQAQAIKNSGLASPHQSPAARAEARKQAKEMLNRIAADVPAAEPKAD